MIPLISSVGNAPMSQSGLLAEFPFWSFLQVLLTASIALIPPLYPRLSQFHKRTQKGLDTLEQPILVIEDITKGTLGENDEGFEEIVTAIENHYPLSGEVKRLNVLRGEPESLRSELEIELGSMVGPNAILYVDYSNEVDQDMDIVTFHPFDPAQTLKLTELRRWVRTTTTERSHYATMVAVLIWTLVSIISLL